MDDCLDGSSDGYAGRMEVIEGRSGLRQRSEAERSRIAAESHWPGARVVDVARRHGVTRWQVYDWRKELAAGKQAATDPTDRRSNSTIRSTRAKMTGTLPNFAMKGWLDIDVSTTPRIAGVFSVRGSE